MRQSHDGFNYVARLDKGERFSEAFLDFAKTAEVDTAWMMLIGSVLEVSLGYYNLDTKTYQWQTFEGLREMTGVQGNVARDEQGEPLAHLHGTFADENYQVIGGHVKDFIAGATVEIFVHKFESSLRRQADSATGLQLLNI